MKQSVKMVLAAGATLLLGACNGWPDTVPYQEALAKPEKYPTYAATAEHPVEFYAGNHRYMVLPTEVDLRTARTQPVSTGAGVSVFSLERDQAPYAPLFARDTHGRIHAVGLID